MKQGKRVVTSVYLDREDLVSLKALSERTGISSASLMREAVRDYLRKRKAMRRRASK